MHLFASSRTISPCLITAGICLGNFSEYTARNFKNAVVHCSTDFMDFLGLAATNLYSELPALCKRTDFSEVKSSLGSNLTKSIYLFCQILFFNFKSIWHAMGDDNSSKSSSESLSDEALLEPLTFTTTVGVRT